jgi:hypothetical protein
MKPQRTTVAIVALALVSACTAATPLGSSPTQPSPTQLAETGPPQPVVLTATLNDEGCSVDGVVAFDSGPVRIEVDNQDAKDRASFQLLRIGEGGTFEAFDAHVAEEQSRIDAGEDPIGAPAYATEVTGTLIDAGTQDQLEARLDEGNYVLVCADWADGGGEAGNHPAGGGRLIVATRLIADGTPLVPSPTAAGLRPSASGPLGPVARGYAMMADLPGEPGVVLLGGATRPGPIDLSDMWTFEPVAGWQEITPPALPELTGFAPLTGTAFAFDTESGLAVFVDIKGNPWTYDATTNRWANKPTGAGPTALLGAAMAYDSGADRMIVFGGFDLATSRENNETWAYDVDSSTWERMLPQQSPSPRNFSAMAYDAASDRVILFGGAPASGVLGDTWAYDYESDTWTEMSPPTSPLARTYSWMVYDPNRDLMILFGGSEDTETASLGDVWEYDLESNRWTNVSPHDGPGARSWHAMAYDEEASLIVVFGGGGARTQYTAETWLLDPTATSWTQAE